MRFPLAILAAVACAAYPVAALPADPVVPPGWTYAGRAPHELATQWWQWLEAKGDVPASDRTGAWCRLGNMGRFWFLAGSIGAAPVRRTCYIPHGRALFFPLITATQWPDELDPYATCERSKAKLATLNDHAKGLYVSLDGKPVADVARYRVATRQCFDMSAMKKPAKPRKYPAAQDGYWMIVAPLSKGVHHLKFGGNYAWPVDTFGDATQNIEYELHIY